MTIDCQSRVRSLILASALVPIAIIATGCSEASAPIVPKQYIVTTSKSTAAAGDTVIVKAQLVDASDQPVHKSSRTVSWYFSGFPGNFTSERSITDESGVASNYFVVGAKANVSNTIYVIDEYQVRGEAPPINVIAGPPIAYQVSPSTTSAPVSATISLSAQLTDNFGNPISLAGRVVTWSIQTGGGGYSYQRGVRTNRLAAPGHAQKSSTTGGTFSSPTSITNGQGLATVDFTVGTTVNDSYIIVATDNQAAKGTSAQISVQAGPIAKFVVSAPVTDPPAGAPLVLTAYPIDAYGNRVNQVGIQVNWSATGAGGTLSSTVTFTASDGTVTNLLTTGTTPGVTYFVSASDGGQANGTSPAITTIEQVSLASLATGIGAYSSCGIAVNGVVWCWGGQTGALFNPRSLPGKPIGNQSMSALSNGPSHSCGIAGGTVMCWGDNDVGQLGDNSRTNRTQPAPINSSLSFTAVSAGSAHTCALATTGDIYCWGSFNSGRLGDGTGFTGLGPIKVAGSVSFTTVSAGDAHTCALATSGDAYCWGLNDHGQLGNGSTATASSPTLVSGSLKFTAIAVGNSHTCGISAGAIYCWGDNTFGELGDGTMTPRTTPTVVKGTLTYARVAAGGFNTCAITSDAHAYCWGSNALGEVGDPNFTQFRTTLPVPVAEGLAFQSIAVGGSGSVSTDYYYGPSAEGHSCGLTTTGVAYCWGSNTSGALGVGPLPASSATPLKVLGQH